MAMGSSFKTDSARQFAQGLSTQTKATFNSVQTHLKNTLQPFISETGRTQLSDKVLSNPNVQTFKQTTLKKAFQRLLQLFEAIIIGLQILLNRLRAYYFAHY